jgi:hypothetical protein
MLPSIHTSIKQLIYERGRISPREVDVRVGASKRTFLERLTLPTINLFLCDVTENAELRRDGSPLESAGGGSKVSASSAHAGVVGHMIDWQSRSAVVELE